MLKNVFLVIKKLTSIVVLLASKTINTRYILRNGSKVYRMVEKANCKQADTSIDIFWRNKPENV